MAGIQLGLRRILKLVEPPKAWKAVHVAGTNGKGSVCNHTYNLLLASGVRCGMFTSPHLIDRWDCISLNGSPISYNQFNDIETRMKARNSKLNIDATPFELLTATAFTAFTESNVEAAVIETGLGGLEDATNIIEKPVPAVITKIGLDHENILGKGIRSIVDHKAGIMKYASPCLIDGTNTQDVLLMLEEKAKSRNIRPLRICHLSTYSVKPLFSNLPGWSSLDTHKRMHLILAYESAKTALRALKKPVPNWETLLSDISERGFPGRQQSVSIANLTGRLPHVLLDGCHNEESAMALETLVTSKYRKDNQNGMVWVLAASGSKDIKSIFEHLVKDGDDVVATEFGPVDGMPWVTPVKAEEIVKTLALQVEKPRSCTKVPDVLEALQQATNKAENRPLVIAGSLYLVSDVLRLLRDHRSTVQRNTS